MNKNNDTFEFKFTMLGARRVGKTSLLAAMYNKLTEELENTSICITRETRTSAILAEKFDLLIAQAEKAIIKVDPSAGIEGSADIEKYQFSLGENGKKPNITISFSDYPGGWLKPSSGRQDEVCKIVSESDAILVAIDAPALMEESGQFEKKINQPNEIYEVLKKSIKDENPKLILFCPVKAESYLKKGRTNDLIARIRESYKGSIAFLKSLENLSVAIVPVQTMGCVLFNSIQLKDDGEPQFSFIKLAGESYSPQNCDQPLIYLISFFLSQYINRPKGILESILNWFNKLDNEEKAALEKLATKLKRSDDGIRIEHGSI